MLPTWCISTCGCGTFRTSANHLFVIPILGGHTGPNAEMNKDFEILMPAVAEIRRRFKESGYSEPVGALGQATAPLRPSAELRDAIRHVRDDELLAVARRDFEKVASNLEFHLTVFVYDASECRPAEIVEISGVRLVMNHAMQDALRGLALDFGPTGFVFRRPDGSVERLPRN